jgi:hypothetical protein
VGIFVGAGCPLMPSENDGSDHLLHRGEWVGIRENFRGRIKIKKSQMAFDCRRLVLHAFLTENYCISLHEKIKW